MLKTLGTAFSASILCIGFAATSAFATPTESSKGFSGTADWYSDYYHLKKTASGQLHDKTKFMAAHRSLPFGTKLRIINHKNGKECVVTVNDRGPYTPGRVIDLSYAAAKHLGITSGSKLVECAVVPKETKATELSTDGKPVEIASNSKTASAKETTFTTVAAAAKATATATPTVTVAATPKATPSVAVASTPKTTPSVAVASTPKTTPAVTVATTPKAAPTVAAVATPKTSLSPAVSSPAVSTPVAAVAAAPKISQPLPAADRENTFLMVIIPAIQTKPTQTNAVASNTKASQAPSVAKQLQSAPIPGATTAADVVASSNTKSSAPAITQTRATRMTTVIPKAASREFALDPSTVED